MLLAFAMRKDEVNKYQGAQRGEGRRGNPRRQRVESMPPQWRGINRPPSDQSDSVTVELAWLGARSRRAGEVASRSDKRLPACMPGCSTNT